MLTHSAEISYAAHTGSCIFLLDAEGICLRIVMKPTDKRRRESRVALNCVGAQYVASLDGSAAGGIVELPRVGTSMLFARVDERGRVSLVRTGKVTAFESEVAEEAPFEQSGSVETSAPQLATHETTDLAGVTASNGEEIAWLEESDYFESSERTERLEPNRKSNHECHELATAEYDAIDTLLLDAAPPPKAPSTRGRRLAPRVRPPVITWRPEGDSLTPRREAANFHASKSRRSG